MPDNDACEGAFAALRKQHERIGELLGEAHDGRWWPDDHVGSEDAATVLRFTRAIEDNVREIACIVAAMNE